MAEALLPLIKQQEPTGLSRLQTVFDSFPERYETHYQSIMARKLGFHRATKETAELVEGFLLLMAEAEADFTNSFRYLSSGNEPGLEALFEPSEKLPQWMERYTDLLAKEGQSREEAGALMLKNNPRFVLRNYFVQHAIERAEAKDFSEVARLRQALSDPFNDSSEWDDLCLPAPGWARNLSVSCSS